MKDAVIVSTARTGIGKAGRGSLNLTHGATMGGRVADVAVERAGIDPALVEDSIWGCGYPEYVTGGNIARQIVVRAGFPVSIAGTTVNRFCGSGLEVVNSIAAKIGAGFIDAGIGGGVESMSRVPLGAAREFGFPYGQTVLDRYGVEKLDQGTGAELIAEVLCHLQSDDHARCVRSSSSTASAPPSARPERRASTTAPAPTTSWSSASAT